MSNLVVNALMIVPLGELGRIKVSIPVSESARGIWSPIRLAECAFGEPLLDVVLPAGRQASMSTVFSACRFAQGASLNDTGKPQCRFCLRHN